MVFLSHTEPEINYVIFTGRVVRKQSLARTSFGSWLLVFSVRNTMEILSGDGKERHESVSVLKVEAWGDLGRKTDELLEIDSPVLVEGQIVSRDFEDRTKATRHRIVVKASRIQPLDTVG